MDALEREKRTASTVALAFNVIGAGVKLAGAVLSGSVSLLSEATHSATDVLASTISFFGVRAASVPPDEEHPYGHGKIESLAGFGESILLIVIVAYVVWEAIQRLASGPGVVRLDVALVIMSAMMVGSFAVSRYVGAVGRRTRSLVLQSNSQHLMSDVYTSAGVVVALGLMRFAGWMQADAIIAIALAAWIGYNAQVLRGVRVGDNAVIGANSVVTRDIPANAVAAGTPARVVRMREEPQRLRWRRPVEPPGYGPAGPR